MTSNETVEQLCDKLHKLGGEIHRLVVLGEDEIHTLSHTIDEAQDLILKAHQHELATKTAEIAELIQAIRQTISACCGDCPAFDEGRYCTYIGPCNWKYLHTTLFGASY